MVVAGHRVDRGRSLRDGDDDLEPMAARGDWFRHRERCRVADACGVDSKLGNAARGDDHLGRNRPAAAADSVAELAAMEWDLGGGDFVHRAVGWSELFRSALWVRCGKICVPVNSWSPTSL